ncbi:putative ATP-dependent DNA helicase YjcD [Andreprevotia sp. IGB-42]|uniref:UvrD-helicase domain-containing protein n=1 Tax=Andreprevotia sp. IGB-42 TaxID=2497473 RepID=UPI00135BBF96|nr:ATP-dependent helicase [Andreprevotia sp. IGB-42]KAF0813513.1 putative ATP-dependent DNA helicase YjcD [Andreprevotia sp. IGB-42]
MTFPGIDINDELAAILGWPAARKAQQHLLIEATAGTGKTTALAALHGTLARAGMRALVLTFSRRGDMRFKAQYKALVQPGISPAELTNVSGTFDSFAIRCLRDHAAGKRWEAGSLGRARNADDRAFIAMREAISDLNAAYGLRDEAAVIGYGHDDLAACLDTVANLKVSLTFAQPPFSSMDLDYADEYDWEVLEATLEGMDLPPWAYALFLKYEKARERLDFLSHGDAAYDLSQEPDAIARFVAANRIQYVLVDEFHDTKAVHFSIIQALARAGVAIVAVGDRGQDIFEWRGFAPFSAFGQFEAVFSDVLHLPLSATYRFGLPLAKSASNLLKTISASSPAIRPRPKANTLIKAVESGAVWTDAVIQVIGKLLKDGALGKDIAVIVPGTRMAYPLMAALHAAKLPFYCAGVAPLPVTREALILRACVLLHGWYAPAQYSYLDCRALVQLAASPALPASNTEVIRSMLTVFNNETRQFDYLVADTGHALSLLRHLYGDLPDAFGDEAVNAWLERTNVWQWFGSLAKNQQDMQAGRSLLEDLLARLLADGASAFARQLDAQYSAYDAKVPAARKLAITTVSQCKGNEWPYVILPSAGDYDWAEHFDATASQQQKRELYVAMTRAKDGLFIVKPKVPKQV